ncbi:hypothetical protein [Mycobacterium sp. 1274756.6]|uniref:MmcQ/YjbR family DNA-binding protein n=1 Tax=Mycobacterium sp. 1274756.6 TaxID=1834076 RepID=UPI000801C8FE|nr:hypothetical protein [Mycobacterium sp. 1274756.6]OBJ68278.1 hypothetical protein A5643_14140 [Mycobacterium sp. 1274756.6]
MATWRDVARLVDALPLTERHAGRDWRVGKKLVVWERPPRYSDRQHYPEAGGDDPEGGDILAARVRDETTKAALIAERPAVFFTTPHFDGYPVVLIRLPAIGVAELAEVITDAWLVQVPRVVAREYLSRRG